MTTISVTQEDIFLGEVGDCCECPAARAVRRAFPGCIGASVGPFAIFVSRIGGRVQQWPASQELREFMRAFDDGEPVQPFSFDLP
jgi:hypothetical protein